MNKAPAFLFYAGDFLSSPDVQAMDTREIGAYCLLLFNAWQGDLPGHLPNNEDRLRRMTRLTVAEWEVSRELLLSKFPVADMGHTRYNPRLVAEAEKQAENRAKNAANGKRGGRPKKPSESQNNPPLSVENPTLSKTKANANPNESISISISTSTNVDEEREQDSSSSALKLEVGGQPLNASPTAPTSVAGRPADPAKAAAIATTDYDDEQPWQESPLTKPAAFQIICDRVALYQGIAYEHYRQLALAAMEGTETRRTVKQWQSWIHKFLTNQTPKGGKLLTGAEVADQARTGVNAPQYVGGYRHEVLPEVQAQRQAEQQASVQARIAANLARNHPQPVIPQPGGVARTF